ncbi:hypothetical protein HID58_014652 [Brassica napus]|uniref:RNase H type-1 domain-containing protein n=1 Tax=Brassica napus TaxID=3708 RepID=A0ABQ8DHQ6_BRANA|nr:hypothetical protein HID58_014652 [Brassica napus]
MISLKIVSEFSVIKGKFSSITVDLLPNNLPLRRTIFLIFGEASTIMADSLHRAIGAINQLSLAATSRDKLEKWEGPPGFPPMFPELSQQDQKMAMLYISHADETERMARIERVKQGIVESQANSSAMITKITRDLDKGKGHVYSFPEPAEKRHQATPARLGSSTTHYETLESDAESGSSAFHGPVFSAPAMASAGFHLGPSSEGESPETKAQPNPRGNALLHGREGWAQTPTVAHLPCLTLCWDGDANDHCSTMDRIKRCRRKIMEWKKRANLNSRDKIVRLRAALEKEVMSESWEKPPQGDLKCNVSSVWNPQTKNVGAAWIIRDSDGKALFHSRRSFAGVRSPFEATLISLVWTTEALNDIQMKRVHLESTDSYLRNSFSQASVPWSLQPLWRRFRKALDKLETYRVVRITDKAIAQSALQGQWQQSYLAINGPFWLQTRIRMEAL